MPSATTAGHYRWLTSPPNQTLPLKPDILDSESPLYHSQKSPCHESSGSVHADIEFRITGKEVVELWPRTRVPQSNLYQREWALFRCRERWDVGQPQHVVWHGFGAKIYSLFSTKDLIFGNLIFYGIFCRQFGTKGTMVAIPFERKHFLYFFRGSKILAQTKGFHFSIFIHLKN